MDVLLAGCGWLGTEVARRLLDRRDPFECSCDVGEQEILVDAEHNQCRREDCDHGKTQGRRSCDDGQSADRDHSHDHSRTFCCGAPDRHGTPIGVREGKRRGSLRYASWVCQSISFQ